MTLEHQRPIKVKILPPHNPTVGWGEKFAFYVERGLLWMKSIKVPSPSLRVLGQFSCHFFISLGIWEKERKLEAESIAIFPELDCKLFFQRTKTQTHAKVSSACEFLYSFNLFLFGKIYLIL